MKSPLLVPGSVRIATRKFVVAVECPSICDAIDRLVADHLRASKVWPAWGGIDIARSDAYRSARLYEKDAADILLANQVTLEPIHQVFAKQMAFQVGPGGELCKVRAQPGGGRRWVGGAGGCVTPPPPLVAQVVCPLSAGGKYMSVEGWLALLETTGILDGQYFTRADAVLAFSCSRMRVSNDVDVQRWTQATHLSYPDFLEALCRVTDMVSLPTEADLIAAPYAGDVEAFHTAHAAPGVRRRAPDEWQYSQTSELLHARLVRFLPMLFVRLKLLLGGVEAAPPAPAVAAAVGDSTAAGAALAASSSAAKGVAARR